MNDAPPAGRSRTDVDAEHPYVKGEPWLEDGNVVLVAEGTAFRVFRSVLSKNSDVFCDMFMLPQRTDAETFDGCPVVHLADPMEEVRDVLLALFDGV